MATKEKTKFDCAMCEDTGEVSAMGFVYPGEPHMADVETVPCECRIDDDDHYGEDLI